MINKPALKVLSAVTALALASMSCGIGGNTPDPTEAPKPTDVVVDEPTAEPVDNGGDGAITSWEEAENATIQILAEGSFVDPAEGFLANAVGAGSGFLISPDGLAVTNNHVVTGSARLKVYLNGEEYRARVLGASECWDLAVIQVVGDGLPYMEPFNGKITVGTDVYSAGFPLGDPEFTLTRGIVSKENADGESNWASVDSVVQHDARINPGNSGGPLINEEGQVIGVNYAGNASTDQNFAIRFQDAQSVIDELADGVDVDSIGINGQAVTNDDGSISGIWVSSVKSGSPADQAGIAGGDILMSMEGVSLGRGGTMSDYCDVIRSHEPGAVLSVDVLRFASSQMLSGQINGRELEVTSDFGTTDNGNTDNGNTDNGNTDNGNAGSATTPVRSRSTCPRSGPGPIRSRSTSIAMAATILRA
jgi:serine protease Do